MIVGVGVDLVAVARLADALTRTPSLARRLFTDDELPADAQRLAGTFAAKEALVKALGGPSSLSWQHVSVVRCPSGQPRMELTGAAADAVGLAGATSVHVSISHDGGHAVAVVILEGR